MDWKIPLFKIYWDEADLEMVGETIQRGMSWAIGPNIERFEEMLAEYVGTKYAVVFNSGTSALHAAYLACGISQGDEVIVPSFTFIATANAAFFVGAKPVFADIEETTFGLDPGDVESRITARTKALVPIHYGGCPCLVEELREIADKHHLVFIEDAAEALGARVHNRKAGSFGQAAILSFCANKVITTGEGGAVVTDSDDIREKLVLIRSHGRAENGDYFTTTEYMDYTTLGYNFRMSDITAGLGIAQLQKIDKIIEMRRQKAATLSGKLARNREVTVPGVPDGFFHVYQMYTIRVKEGQPTRDALIQTLAQNGIMAKVYFQPVHLSHFYRNVQGYECQLPVTERISQQVLTLPLYPTLTEDEINYIAANIETFFRQARSK